MKFKFLCLFLFYLLPFYKCFSQSSVYGQVKFTDDSSQVSYTASIFSSKDSSYIIGNWFSSAQFSLNIDTSKSVYLKIQSLGYTDVLLSLRKSSDLNVGEIFMSHSSQNNLKEIVVRADKPIYETKNGNLTVNVSSSNLVNSNTSPLTSFLNSSMIASITCSFLFVFKAVFVDILLVSIAAQLIAMFTSDIGLVLALL